MRCRRSAVAVALLFIANSILTQISASPQAQPSSSGKRPITEKDLFNFTWIANPQLSPDGPHVPCTRVVVDKKPTGYGTSISTVACTGKETPLRMTNSKHHTKLRSPHHAR